MNHVLSIVRAARNSSEAGGELQSVRMLAELLALHEETLAQLCRDRIGALDTVVFLTGMIEQHECAARNIRAQLEAGAESGGQPVLVRPPQMREAS